MHNYLLYQNWLDGIGKCIIFWTELGSTIFQETANINVAIGIVKQYNAINDFTMQVKQGRDTKTGLTTRCLITRLIQYSFCSYLLYHRWLEGIGKCTLYRIELSLVIADVTADNNIKEGIVEQYSAINHPINITKRSFLWKIITKRWFKRSVAYYPNADATFNFMALVIELSGDVHPMPGPTGNDLQKIPVRITNRQICSARNLARCRIDSHLIHIKPIRTSNQLIHTQPLDFCLWNVRSIKNKSLMLKDYVVDHNLEFLALTETWLRPGDIDNYHIEELCPTGYVFYHSSRTASRGGGVGLLIKRCFHVKKQSVRKFDSFEYM